MLIKRNPTPGLLAASRANGARSRRPADGACSRGATTAAGKAVSAFAGLRHGLYSAAAVLPTESHPGFVALREEFLADLRPRTPHGPASVPNLSNEASALVEQLASALWCLQRARVAESEIVTACLCELFPNVHHYTPAHLSAAFSHIAGRSGILDHIGRFESRHERRFHRALHHLGLLRETPVVANRDPVAANSKMEMPPVNALKTQPVKQHSEPVTQEPRPAVSANAATPGGRFPHLNSPNSPGKCDKRVTGVLHSVSAIG